MEQGLFFNTPQTGNGKEYSVAIPLEQGLFFNAATEALIDNAWVAIPLEQGLFFNSDNHRKVQSISRNPFGAGTIF